MQIISEASLNNDVAYRVQYLRDFIGFTAQDAATLLESKPLVSTLVPAVVDAVYEKLLSFDVTAKSFVPRQTGYSGAAPSKLADLSPEHPQIKFRKDFLAQYLGKLVTMDYEKTESWEYLDKVGLMHTGHMGFAHRRSRAPLRVEYMHCAILLGYVEDMLVNAVGLHPTLDDTTKTTVLRAFNKILWIQNDLFARHYMVEDDPPKSQGLSLSAIGNPSLLALISAGVTVVGFAAAQRLWLSRS